MVNEDGYGVYVKNVQTREVKQILLQPTSSIKKFKVKAMVAFGFPKCHAARQATVPHQQWLDILLAMLTHPLKTPCLHLT